MVWGDLHWAGELELSGSCDLCFSRCQRKIRSGDSLSLMSQIEARGLDLTLHQPAVGGQLHPGTGKTVGREAPFIYLMAKLRNNSAMSHWQSTLWAPAESEDLRPKG